MAGICLRCDDAGGLKSTKVDGHRRAALAAAASRAIPRPPKNSVDLFAGGEHLVAAKRMAGCLKEIRLVADFR